VGRRDAAALALALVLGAPGCGYGFSTRYVAVGGAESLRVAAFENRSSEPELGASVSSALRGALARRGALSERADGPVVEGEVAASDPAPSSPGGATWRIAVEVRARLRVAGAPVEERTVRREVDYLAGGDPLESEARRALALRRASDEVAVEVLRAFER
jgi:hypothetical protein